MRRATLVQVQRMEAAPAAHNISHNMNPQPMLLFVYGTLHPDRAPRAIADAARRLRPVGDAIIRGRLLDLGEYPGLVLADPARPDHGSASESKFEEVAGEVFEVPDLATLATLDAYEDFRPNDPDASLFLRVKAAVTMSGGRELTCWVYIYNHP